MTTPSTLAAFALGLLALPAAVLAGIVGGWVVMVTEIAFSWVPFSFDVSTAILSYKVIAALVLAVAAGVAVPPLVAKSIWGTGPHTWWALVGAVVALLAVAAWWWARSARAV